MVAEPRNSGKSAKSCEIHKNTKNTAKFGRNLVKYMSVQRIWNLFQLLDRGYLLAVNLQIYLRTSSLKRANNIPKLPGVDYGTKNWALAIMLKALPLVHFWSVLLLREQMMTSVRKTLKTLVWSAQNRLISSEFALKITTKSAVFLLIAFRWSLPQKFSRNSCEISRFFREFFPKNPAKFDFFSATYQKPCFIFREHLFWHLYNYLILWSLNSTPFLNFH